MQSKAKPALDINDEYQQRASKLKNLRLAKVDPYPSQTKPSLSTADFLSQFKQLLKNKKKVILHGRLLSIRLQGGSCFMHLSDANGKVQIWLRKDVVGEKNYSLFKNNFDQGDFVELSGTAFLTKTKEPTLMAVSIKILAKTLLSLPDEYYGLKDADLRYRKRHLDILVNPAIKKVFLQRSQIIKLTRQWFDEQGFIEVDTPILQTVAGGAAAKPFVTHHQTLKMDLYLRVAPELYLKRLIIGGYEQVYELGRCFRNEGIDHQHNPEFTQVEAYWAYKDYQFLMTFIEKYLSWLVKNINHGSLKIKNGHDVLDFKPPYPRLDFRQALNQAIKHDIDKSSYETLQKLAKQAQIAVDKSWGRGKLLDELYKKFVRKNIVKPTFIINHPLELSPLAKRLPDRQNYVERFQLVVKGAEICNAFSELNDPMDQEARFKEQSRLRKAGDDEAFGADADFVEALKHGMPPTAGLGLGIDRLVMLLTDQENVKEVILFPTMRPKGK
ncbi:MAG: lysine--tRNA ligase [Patescibacteria group bacterium]